MFFNFETGTKVYLLIFQKYGRILKHTFSDVENNQLFLDLNIKIALGKQIICEEKCTCRMQKEKKITLAKQ